MRSVDIVDFWKRYRRNRAAVFGLVVIILIIIMALTASLFYPNDPFRLMGKPLSGPLTMVLAGVTIGRDVASGIVHGAKTSLLIGFVATIVSVFIGIFFGALRVTLVAE